MILFKSTYTAKSIKKSLSNAISSVRLDKNDVLYLKEISTQKKARLFLKVGAKFRSQRSLILQWLYLRSGGHDVSVPQEGIAHDLDVSVRTIKRWVKELLDEGYINVRWYRNENGLNSTSTMRLTPKAWRELIGVATGWCKSIKNSVRLYMDSVKALNLGSATMSPSTELIGGVFRMHGNTPLQLPRNTPIERINPNLYVEIPF